MKIQEILHSALNPVVPEICKALKDDLIEELVEFILAETKYSGSVKEIVEKVHAKLDEKIKTDAS